MSSEWVGMGWDMSALRIAVSSNRSVALPRKRYGTAGFEPRATQ